MRYAKHDNDGALFWADRGVGYVVSGGSDRERLTQIARLVYDQTEKSGGMIGVPIPTLKIWNQDICASQNRTGCSRENE